MINGISSTHLQSCRPNFIKTLPFANETNVKSCYKSFKSASIVEPICSEPKITLSQENGENPIIPDEVGSHDMDSFGKDEANDTNATNEIGIFKIDDNVHKMDIIEQYTPGKEKKLSTPSSIKMKCSSARQSNLSLILSRNKELQKLEGEPTIKV